MAEKCYTLITNVGKAKIANSIPLGIKVNFTKFKVGDGNGSYYEPTESQTNLINTKWEGPIGSVYVDENNSNWIVVDTVIPADIGGFFIREAGIFDDQNNLIAISKLSESYKPVFEDGTTKEMLIRLILEVSNTASVTLKLDPTVILATKRDIQILDAKVQDITAQMSDLTYQVATGTATAITLTMQTLVNGYAKTFIASANNSGVATTINGKPLYKPGTTTAPNLIAGKAYTVWYNTSGNCFFIKASAEGNVLANQVLKDKTFSNDTDTGLLGTLDLSLLISSNIRAGITINEITGATNVVDTTISSSAATAAMIRAGYKCFINGVLTTGTATEKAAATITPGTTDQTIPSGVITTGVQTIKGDGNLVAANIIGGKSIFGIAGTASIASLGGVTLKTAVGTIPAGTTTVALGWQPKIIVFGLRSNYRGYIYGPDASGGAYAWYNIGDDKVESSWTVSSTGFTMGTSWSTATSYYAITW